MKQLPAIPLKQKYYRYVKAEIQRIFEEVIYRPLFAAIQGAEIRNAVDGDPLFEAIREGVVWFEDGRFYGKFNARISRRLQDIGATFNPKTQTWVYAGTLPVDVSLAMAAATSRYKAIREAVLHTLGNLNIESINNVSRIPDVYDQTIKWMDDDFQKTVKAVTIPPQLTQQQANMIAVEWSQNLDLFIRNWTEQNILKLRQMVQTSAFRGQRAETIVEAIQHNYQVSKSKAEFLARQETSLLMSKFHESRYVQAGLPEYRWLTSKDDRVRDDHEALDGKIFRWSDPPVCDRTTGRKGHPGEDFGCRCVAVPIFKGIRS